MKVLWIGNSHTFFHDMPQLTAKLYEAGTGQRMESVMLTHPGVEWSWHVEQYYEVRYNLKYGQYDYCIMQQAAHPFPGFETTLKMGGQLISMCKDVGTRPIVTVTWAKEKEPHMQQVMFEAYEQISTEYNVQLSLVGYAWQRVLRQCSDINLYHVDGAHASVYGAYLNACCHYHALSGRECYGLPCIGKDFIRDATQDKLRKQVKGILDEVDIELDMEKCHHIQKIVDEVYQIGYPSKKVF